MLKPISTQHLRTLAENAIELVKIVRQWLPVEGDTEPKTGGQRNAENWFYHAADHYTFCERIRNPHKKRFGIASGQYHGPSVCSAAWFEIQTALDEIAVAYRLQGVSDESGCPYLQSEQDVPAVDSGTLKRLELAAGSILEVIGDEPADEKPVEQVEQPKIKLPTNPDVAEVWNAVQAVESGTANVAEICRNIAGKRGCNAGSLRSMFNTWRRKNIG